MHWRGKRNGHEGSFKARNWSKNESTEDSAYTKHGCTSKRWFENLSMQDRKRKRKETATGAAFQPGNNKIYNSWESPLIKGNTSAWKKMKHKMLNLRQGSFWRKSLTAEADNYRDHQTSGGTEGSPRGQQAGTSSKLNDCSESPTLLTAHRGKLRAVWDKIIRNSSSVHPKYLEECAWPSGLLKSIINPEDCGAKQNSGGGSCGGREALLRASPAEHKHTLYHLGGNFMCS